jgi:hypothetical protein
MKKMAKVRLDEADPQVQSVNRADYIFVPETEEEAREWGEELFQRFSETEEGFLKGRSVVTNVGVFTYVNADGTVTRELRPPEEVFNKDSLESLKLKVLTNDHPSVMVTPDNAKDLSVGNLGDDIRRDAYRISTPIIITEEQAIADVQNGKRGLSCGYSTDVVEKSGNWMGVPYDAIQTNIRYNHVAIVPKGRAGDDAVLKLDGVDVPLGTHVKNKEDTNQPKPKKDNLMKKINIDGVEWEADAKVIEVLTQAQAKVDAQSEELTALKSSEDSLKSENSSLQGKLDAAEEENKELKEKLDKAEGEIPKEKLDAAVAAKVALDKAASMAKVKVDKDMTEEEVKKAVILSVHPSAKEKLDSATSEYITARFDAAVEKLEENSENNNNNRQDLGDNAGEGQDRSDDNLTPSEKARKDYIDDLKSGKA